MINGIPLIERVTEKMKKIFQEVIVIANEKERFAYLGLPVVEDIKKGLGPLGGIFYCMRYAIYWRGACSLHDKH